MNWKRSASSLICTLLLLSGSALAEGVEFPAYTVEGFTLTIHEGVQAIGYDTKDWVRVERGMPMPEDVIIDSNIYRIKRIHFPSTLRYLGGYALAGISVSTLEFPEGFETLAADALSYCEIGTLKLPSTFRMSSGVAFSDTFVSNIEISPNHPWYKTVDGVLYSKNGQVLYYYPSGRTDTHFELPAGVRRISDNAFSDNDYLQSITLPVGLEVISQGAFADCGRLVSVALPLTLQEIGNYAFANCVSLQRVSPPPGLALITSAFFNCPLLYDAMEWQGDEGGNEQVEADEKKRVLLPNPYDEEILFSGMGRTQVYQQADITSPGLTSLADGTSVYVTDIIGDWAQITWQRWKKGAETESYEQTGFIPRASVLPCSPGALFTVFDIKPQSPDVLVYEAPFANAAEAPGEEIENIPSQDFRTEDIKGGWLAFTWAKYIVDEDEWISQETTTMYASARDFSYTRVNCGDGRTLCLLLPEEGMEPLLAAPGAQTLAILAGGTHAEVIRQETDYTLVRVNGQVGHVRTDSVFIVPEASE